ncbi:hypothetical protein, partial [Streptomyces mirabilis]|uniref:hypothetical protein n=1 Tax=Streptomyces mirabilis TaxID=68239 RepID=UPI0036D87884
VELHRRERVELRQQGLLDLGWLRNPELPRGPVFMLATSCDHPIETPVRHTPLKIETTTASKEAVLTGGSGAGAELLSGSNSLVLYKGV